jgi:hypothetical protein
MTRVPRHDFWSYLAGVLLVSTLRVLHCLEPFDVANEDGSRDV